MLDEPNANLDGEGEAALHLIDLEARGAILIGGIGDWATTALLAGATPGTIVVESREPAQRCIRAIWEKAAVQAALWAALAFRLGSPAPRATDQKFATRRFGMMPTWRDGSKRRRFGVRLEIACQVQSSTISIVQ